MGCSIGTARIAALIAPVAGRHEQIAVRRDRDVPRRADVVGDDRGAESLWQLEAAVVGVACGRRGAARGRDRDDQAGRRKKDKR